MYFVQSSLRLSAGVLLILSLPLPASGAAATGNALQETHPLSAAQDHTPRELATLLDKADALLKAGRPNEAYDLLEPREAAYSGDADYGYKLGIAALDSDKPDRAAIALERALIVDPDFSGARLELARAYFATSKYDLARNQFDLVLTQNPPEEVKGVVQKYLAAIQERHTAKPQKADAYPERAAEIEQAPETNGNTALVNISRFDVKGNTLLDAAQVENLLAPFKGKDRSYADIQRALEALEGAYRNTGYSAVHVVTPEQEITQGVIIFEVIEAKIGKVILSGNERYDNDNIRNALPALVEGATPSARELSSNLRLANENPTRQLDVVLAVGETENTVDAKVNVKDESPHKFFFTLDNTGNQNTGMYRTGIGYQHNNLFNRDHAATLNYSTSPSHTNSVSQLSASYRLPIYTLGDSIDLIAAYSDTDAGTTSTVAGPLTFSGKGYVYSARYNHYLSRQGDYTSKIIAGFDHREYLNNCSLGVFGPAGCGSAAFDITVHPVSLTYNGTLTKPTHVLDYAATLVRNIPGGSRGSAADFNNVRPSPVGGAGAMADYTILRLNGSLSGVLPENWQYRLAANAQYTADALVSGESFGLVGANTVRGFLEREISSDKGYVFNAELYTPELASILGMQNSSFRLLGFIDHASGEVVPLAGEAATRTTASSIGAGFRFAYSKSIMAKFDWARVTQGAGNRLAGSNRGHISLIVSW